jgi:hypothetical protein
MVIHNAAYGDCYMRQVLCFVETVQFFLADLTDHAEQDSCI